jgi:pyruvate dehydrogenase E2 component (dihydrolipoamide acetyltransferase)
MAIPITIPRLGWNMEEGSFAGWLKRDGDEVKAGEIIFSVEGEKATEEIESLDSGILRIAPEGPNTGDRLAVGAVIGYLLQPGETAPARVATKLDTAPFLQAHASDSSAESKQAEIPVASPTRARRPVGSPRARRVARELQVNWTKLSGSGAAGRIRERDVRAAAMARAACPSGQEVPLGPIRRVIAERMMTGSHSAAPVTLTTTADGVNLVNLRRQFKAVAQPTGEAVPTYTDILLKLTAAALQTHPLLNACWTDDRIITYAGIHIGIAVDTEAGLLVPVVRDVSTLSLKQLAACARDLADRARQRKLSPEEMQGGTFTVTNLGAYGIDAFTPIVNRAQSAILGVGRIQRRPAVRNEAIVIRDEITLSLTFDHRVVDGAPAARFLQTLSRLIENPSASLLM